MEPAYVVGLLAYGLVMAAVGYLSAGPRKQSEPTAPLHREIDRLVREWGDAEKRERNMAEECDALVQANAMLEHFLELCRSRRGLTEDDLDIREDAILMRAREIREREQGRPYAD